MASKAVKESGKGALLGALDMGPPMWWVSCHLLAKYARSQEPYVGQELTAREWLPLIKDTSKGRRV